MRLRLLRALLHLYPASFRAEFGEELCAVFRQRRREASGLLEVCALWLATFIETIDNASAAHWDLLKQDLHYTARSLRRTPGFTLTAIAVSAIGIGATTAAFPWPITSCSGLCLFATRNAWSNSGKTSLRATTQTWNRPRPTTAIGRA